MLLRSLVLLLIVGGAYIAGIMTDIAQVSEFDTKKKIENSVEDFLAYPTAAQYRNVNYHMLNKTADGEETGYYCGEVFGFKNELPYGFKRFIVRYHKNAVGKTMVSIPFVEEIDDIIPKEQFELVWARYCQDNNQADLTENQPE
ncbi:hypothetical protein AB7Y49_14490 [Providencia vermicola]|uniref:Uncharacterized protein n=2 Tax=Providencia TaxID=586 RepID=A0AAI9MTP3_PROST|nr:MULTISPECIES: hypothetical protein [Providencia]ELR5046021.1 hypothetical protein [Providencia rettgeri]MTB38522.1 hypothetical protein [Providencia sp. wls1949]MTC07730.1 hypothetical protein [Providencia sp. wls1948]ELR5033938.1 hypothetical protein [Providencia stuartii]ELR5119696.1 hypothetical protein [Providencia stuartii]